MLLALVVLVGSYYLLILSSRSTGFGQMGVYHPAVGQEWTGLQFEPLVNGEEPVSDAELADRVVLVNFWGPWCGPCRMEMPGLVSLENEYRSREPFRMISVSCGIGGAYRDEVELRDETQAFVNEQGIEFAVFSDPAAVSRETLIASAQLGGFGYPTTVLLDRQQTIRGLWQGYSPGIEDEIAAALDDVLTAGD